MAGNFEDLAEMAEEETELTVEQQLDKDLEGKHSIDKIFMDVYNTSAGRVMFGFLRERFVDIQIAHPGDGLPEIFTRQGKADLVRMMEQAIADAQTSSK